MKDRDFDRLVGLAKERELPGCPPDLERNVLRRLRGGVRSEGGEAFGLDWLLGLFEQTRFAAATMIAVLVISSTASVLATSALASSSDRKGLATDALGFDVFEEAHILHLDK
ncbi:hypothetical protein [Pelagicoccus sp. SDUM812005]|uniref:hypothetical protein n=1 Tax=Pelagicoccus sp. SDUM812005 TaxID=3041257 RepID=UPI00280CAF52|nr:hypothetical protein [Pelagicoccus sp. SDUM812005]MDQ8180525.1 hypothetical protein [Pelagicoccus sp. SDUM812005]